MLFIILCIANNVVIKRPLPNVFSKLFVEETFERRNKRRYT